MAQHDHEVLSFAISTAFKQMLRVHPVRDAMHSRTIADVNKRHKFPTGSLPAQVARIGAAHLTFIRRDAVLHGTLAPSYQAPVLYEGGTTVQVRGVISVARFANLDKQ